MDNAARKRLSSYKKRIPKDRFNKGCISQEKPTVLGYFFSNSLNINLDFVLT